MHALEETVRRATRWLALVGFAGLLLLAAMTSLDALLRSAFSAPIQGVNDVSSVVMAVVIASCVPANLAQRRNISVEVLGAMAGPRVNQLLTIFAGLVVLAFFAVMAWKFVPYAQGMYLSGRRTWVLGWPVWPWWSAAALFLALAVLVQALNVLHDLLALPAVFRAGRTAEPRNSTHEESL